MPIAASAPQAELPGGAVARCLGRPEFGVYFKKYGEPAGVRTQDLLIKSQLLYRLSYRLTIEAVARRCRDRGQGQKSRFLKIGPNFSGVSDPLCI